MHQSWTSYAIQIFPWVGGGAAIVLVILLFGTQYLQSQPGVSKWYDRVWLSWLAVAIYLTHNVEEYGVDVFGRMMQFPAEICSVMKLPPYPDCPIPYSYFISVNVPAFWIGAPIAALLCRRHPLVGLSFYGIIFVNLFFHILPLVAGAGFGPGTLTAILIFIPASVWVIHAAFGAGRLSYKALAFILLNGVVFHVILTAPMILFLKDKIDSTALVLSQLANTVLFLMVPWFAEKWRGGILVKRNA
jgi:hypothetical protein